MAEPGDGGTPRAAGDGGPGTEPSDRAGIAALTFDAALAELERAVAELEAGGLPLERTIALYEQGVALEQHCERLLGDAELRVRRLVETARGTIAEAELRTEDEPAAGT